MTHSSSSYEPVFKIPAVVVAIITLCALIHLGRSLLGRELDSELVARFAFVPARLTAWVAPAATAGQVAAWMQSGDPGAINDVLALRMYLTQPGPPPATLVTYALLHGDWSHLGFNSLWLLAFGTPVARRFGQLRFLLFLVVSAVAGAVAHWMIFRFSAEPVIGASAAVSGCMGAALRFMFDPTHSETTGANRAGRPVAPLRAMLGNPRALSFLAVWFGSNALFGIGSVAFGLTESPIAWQAHVGGFLVGLLLFKLFDPTPSAAQAISEPPTAKPSSGS